MIERESATEIEAQAARWVVRADQGDLTATDRADLQAWLTADPRHQGAYARAEAAWVMLDRVGILNGEAAPAPTETTRDRPPHRRGLLAGLGVAVAACVTVVVAPRLLSARYGTAVGEIRRVPLADGSMAAINTDTRLDVALTPRLRQVRLNRGEAWFQVAKDAGRPFVVESGPVRVRAVGTAFSVRRHDGGCEVLVTEGVVEVWSRDAGAARRLAAGERAFVSDQDGPAPPDVAPIDITRQLAWRDGQIVLDGEAFGAAAAEFNRYNERKIVIADARLADEKLVGWFRTNEPESFANAAAASFGARVTTRGAVILVEARE